VEVLYVERSQDGFDGYSFSRTIVLVDDLYPARKNFIFCHELAHILLGHSLRTTRRPSDEFEADRLAAELMLPEAEFKPLALQFDLAETKARFPHASWEVVARRWAEFRSAVLTIFDNGKQTNRVIPPGLTAPIRVSDVEYRVIRRCFEEAQSSDVSAPPLNMRAYYINDGRGVERVILLTEWEGYD